MSRSRLQTRRNGVALQEAMVSLLIAGAVLVAVVQLLAVVARQQRLCQERSLATREIGNVMEQLMVQPWEALTEEELAAWELPETARDGLPGAKLHIEVAAESEADDLRRLTVQIAWPDDGPVAKSPVRLVAWRSQGQEDES